MRVTGPDAWAPDKTGAVSTWPVASCTGPVSLPRAGQPSSEKPRPWLVREEADACRAEACFLHAARCLAGARRRLFQSALAGVSVRLPSLLGSRRTEESSLPCVASSCHQQAPELPFVSLGRRWPSGWQPSLGPGSFLPPSPWGLARTLTHECQPILRRTWRPGGRVWVAPKACAVRPPQRGLWMWGRGGSGALDPDQGVSLFLGSWPQGTLACHTFPQGC